MQSNTEYLAASGLPATLAEAISEAVRTQPADPVDFIGSYLLQSKAKSSPLADEEARKREKPMVDGPRAVTLALELYGLKVVPGSLKDLDSYDDRNFYIKATHTRPELADEADGNLIETAGSMGGHFVFKVHNGVESLNAGFVECQNLAMAAVRSSGIWCPRALPSLDGSLIAFAPHSLADGTSRQHAIRCLPFKPASLMGGVLPTEGLLAQVGVLCAKVSRALSQIDHPAAHRIFVWDLAQTLECRPLLAHLSAERQQLIGSVLDEFEARVLPRAPALRTCVIHGDINDQNVLVSEPTSAGGERSVVGVIDFGDMCHTWLVNEVAIAAAYAVIALHYERPKGEPTPAEQPSLGEVEACVAMVTSYAAHMSAEGHGLSDVEWHVLPTLIACRIAMSLCIGAYSSAQDPTNEYLQLTLLPGLHALRALRATSADDLMRALKAGPKAGSNRPSWM